MGLVTLPITSRVPEDDNDFADVYGNDSAITTQVNGNLENVNIASGAGISPSKLASMATGQALIGNSGVPTATTLSGDATISAAGVITHASNSVYRTLRTASGVATDAFVGGTYLFNETGQALTGSGNGNLANGGFAALYLDDADYTISGRNTRLRLRAQVMTNASAPVITFTFGLYPFTVAGGADVLTATLGTVVSGSTVAIATPSASTITSGVGSDFAVPSDGAYMLGVVLSNPPTSDNVSQLGVQLQLRHV